MSKIFNRSDQTLKRHLRVTWKHLRDETLGVKFRRQVSIGRYIVDFYCPSLHLAIEVDGESHAGDEAQAYDELRQREIESLGVRFIRVTNEDVYRNPLNVAESIALVVAEMKAELDEENSLE